MNRNSLFEYKGVRFRKLGRLDLTALMELKNESWEDRHAVHFLNMDDQGRWFDSLDQNTLTPSTLILMAMTEDQVGHDAAFGVFKLSAIDWQNRKASAGWDVFAPFRKKGLGKRLVAAGVQFAKEVLNLHRLRADILITNVASRKCALEAGFVKEGVEREAVLRKGTFIDSEIYGVILR